MLVLGLILVLAVSIIVKIFDSEIRPVHWRKVAVVWATFAGFIFIIVGVIQMFLQ